MGLFSRQKGIPTALRVRSSGIVLRVLFLAARPPSTAKPHDTPRKTSGTDIVGRTKPCERGSVLPFSFLSGFSLLFGFSYGLGSSFHGCGFVEESMKCIARGQGLASKGVKDTFI